jgi:hypothetical protein
VQSATGYGVLLLVKNVHICPTTYVSVPDYNAVEVDSEKGFSNCMLQEAVLILCKQGERN